LLKLPRQSSRNIQRADVASLGGHCTVRRRHPRDPRDGGIREGGLPVVLTERSAEVYRTNLRTLLRTNPVADVLVQSTSLANAEQSAVAVLGFTELDHERAKAAAIVRGGKVTNTEPVRSAAAWTAVAARRGVAYTTFRRIAEAIGYRDVPALRPGADPKRPGAVRRSTLADHLTAHAGSSPS
jgi:hypothetical protein